MTLIPILEKGLNRKEMCRLPCFMTTDAKFLSHCLLCDSVQITIITHLNYWNDLISTLVQSPILKAASGIILLNMSNDLSFQFYSIPGLLSHIDLYVVPKTLTTFSSQGLCTSSLLVWSILILNKFTFNSHISFRPLPYSYTLIVNFSDCFVQSLSPVQLFVTWWAATCQAPLSMGFCREEHWSGLPCPPLRDLPHPGFNPASPSSPVLASGFLPPRKPPRKPHIKKHFKSICDGYLNHLIKVVSTNFTYCTTTMFSL